MRTDARPAFLTVYLWHLLPATAVVLTAARHYFGAPGDPGWGLSWGLILHLLITGGATLVSLAAALVTVRYELRTSGQAGIRYGVQACLVGLGLGLGLILLALVIMAIHFWNTQIR